MNTIAQHRRAAAFAAVVLALALPLAANQTAVGSTDVAVASAQLKDQSPQSPDSATLAGRSPLAQCIAEYVTQGFGATRVAPALCASHVRAY